MEDHRPRPRFESISAYDVRQYVMPAGSMFALDADGYDFRMQIWNDVSFSGEMLLWESAARAHYEEAITRSVACRLAGYEIEAGLWNKRANDFAKEFGFEGVGNGDSSKANE